MCDGDIIFMINVIQLVVEECAQGLSIVYSSDTLHQKRLPNKFHMVTSTNVAYSIGGAVAEPYTGKMSSVTLSL